METLVIVAQHRNQYHRRGKSHHHHPFGSSPSRGFKEINCRSFQSGTGILPTPFKSFNSSSSPTRKTEKYFENNGKSIPIPIKIKPCNNDKSFNNGYSLKSCNSSSSLNKKPFSSPPTSPYREINGKSFPIPIKIKPCNNDKSFNNGYSLKSCNSNSSLNKKPFSSPPTSPYREEINGKTIPIPINFEPLNTHNSFTDDFSYSELWAGPAYSNSPPPSSLPIPTFSLRRQKRSVSVEIPVLKSEIIVHPVAKSAPPSPTRGLCRSPDNFCLSTASATKDLRRILHLDAGDE